MRFCGSTLNSSMDFRTYFGGGVERTTTSTTGKFNNGINLGFWDTAHLPLP